jgi:nitrogenase molybdenum-iron protein alpha/beta subunit
VKKKINNYTNHNNKHTLVFLLFQIVGIKQYLVRPVDQVFGKDSNTIQNAILPNSTEEPQIPSDMPISETLLQKAGKPLNEVIDQVSEAKGHATHSWALCAF